MGHSSHGHLWSVLKVLKSNFYHQFVSMNIESGKFQPDTRSTSIIRDVLNFTKFYKIYKNFLFRVWAHFQEAKFWHRNKIRIWATDILKYYRKDWPNHINPKAILIKFSFYSPFIFRENFFCRVWWAVWKKNPIFQV